ncbi:ribonuclease H-like domain-containing protein [Eubacteriales bacterium KG127]
MKIIRDKFSISKDVEKIIQSKSYKRFYGNYKPVILDIETTGLSSKQNDIILIGLITIDINNMIGESFQFFAEKNSEEKNILQETTNILNQQDMVITYNGKSFDMPFIYEKCIKHGISVNNIYNLDLYLLVKNYSPLKEKLGSLSQKTMEKFIGIDKNREDEISGGESVKLYENFQSTKDLNQLKKILLHNKDDIHQLLLLLQLIQFFDINKAIKTMGFPDNIIQTENVSLTKSNIKISGTQKNNPIDYIRFPTIEFPGSITFTKNNQSWSLDYPVISRKEGQYADISELFIEKNKKNELNSLNTYIEGNLIISENNRENLYNTATLAMLLKDNVKRIVFKL